MGVEDIKFNFRDSDLFAMEVNQKGLGEHIRKFLKKNFPKNKSPEYDSVEEGRKPEPIEY